MARERASTEPPAVFELQQHVGQRHVPLVTDISDQHRAECPRSYGRRLDSHSQHAAGSTSWAMQATQSPWATSDGPRVASSTPAALATTARRLAVGPLEKMNQPDRLARRDLGAQRQQGFVNARSRAQSDSRRGSRPAPSASAASLCSARVVFVPASRPKWTSTLCKPALRQPMHGRRDRLRRRPFRS